MIRPEAILAVREEYANSTGKGLGPEMARRLVLAAAPFMGQEWWPPKFKRGERVRAMSHRGHLLDGVIGHVETHYDWSPENNPYHIYGILFDGRSRWEHLGERHVTALPPSPEQALEPRNG